MAEASEFTGQVRIQVPTKDLEIGRKYYQDSLGLACVAVFDPSHCLMMQLTGDTFIELVHNPDVATSSELSVEVSSIDNTYRRYAGVADEEPQTEEWGDKSFRITDPSGNRITFFEVAG